MMRGKMKSQSYYSADPKGAGISRSSGSKSKNPKKATAKTGKRILHLLKTRGPQDAETLAESIGISGMAVRQHLYQMHEESWVTFTDQGNGRGRPKRYWQLNSTSARFFPNRHKDLLVNLLEGIKKKFGEEGVHSLLDQRIHDQVKQYRSQIPEEMDLPEQIAILAEIRSGEGYLAEVEEGPHGEWMLIENHCPICDAAKTCRGFCDAELEIFKKILGRNVEVRRTEHILEGHRRCVYTISPRETVS